MPPHAKRQKVASEDKARSPDKDRSISMAITLKGSVITEAILHGYKDVENRSVRLPLGWIGLHTGKGKCDALLDQIVRRLAPPDAPLPPDAECPKGCVVGAAWVQRTVTFDELRTQFGCTEACHGPNGVLHHVPQCKFSPHAGGPICNILSASVRLPKAVPCNGELGCWRLPDDVREEVLKQFDESLQIYHFPEVGLRPRAWPLPWAPQLSRKEVFWHRDLAKEKALTAAKTAPVINKATSLHRFF